MASDSPPAVITLTSTSPVPAGLVTVSWSSFATDSPVPGLVVAPKYTVVAPVKPLPVSVTKVPPDGGPAFGLTDETTGFGSTTWLRMASVIVARFQNTGTLLVTPAVPSSFQLRNASGQIQVRGPS